MAKKNENAAATANPVTMADLLEFMKANNEAMQANNAKMVAQFAEMVKPRRKGKAKPEPSAPSFEKADILAFMKDNGLEAGKDVILWVNKYGNASLFATFHHLQDALTVQFESWGFEAVPITAYGSKKDLDVFALGLVRYKLGIPSSAVDSWQEFLT